MFKRNRLLFFLILLLISSSIFWGCGQPEDVLTPLTRTNIKLNPSKLPTNPDGMVYELWVANASDTIPLGKFGYDFPTTRFLEADGTPRTDSNQFFLGHDLMDFTTILVSVETYPDDNTNSPGPIMLMDMTTSQTIKLRFPKIDSLWAATLWYNMESPSDGSYGDSVGLDPVTDGYSIWFSTYNEVLRSLNDTLSIDSSYITADTLDGYASGDTTMIVVIGVDTNSIYLKDTALIRGLDTIVHTVVRFDVLLDTLVETPYYMTTLGVVFGVDSGWISFDMFTQGDNDEEFALPVLTEYGWKYKGWVASPCIDSNAITSRITPPAWAILGDPLEETEGALLTTGTFADVRFPDDCNPYVASSRVPPYPGEDFLENLPGNPSIDPPCFVPNLVGGNPGRVFVSLEPANFNSDTTNFPLIPFIGDLPDSRAEVTDPAAVQSFVLRGWMQDSSDPYRGFPWILVEIERF